MPVLWIVCEASLGSAQIAVAQNKNVGRASTEAFICLSLGLLGGLAIGYVTELMTSYSYRPVQ